MDEKTDETSVITGAWVAHSRVKKEVASQLLFVSQALDSLRRGLAQARYNFKREAISTKEPIVLVQEGLSPTNLAMHPKGDGVVISSERGCKFFNWDESAVDASIKRKAKVVDLQLSPEESPLKDLEDVGPQTCMQFSRDGNLLAIGGKDGCIRVFQWPSMDIVLDSKVSKEPVKDLDFSLDSALLAAISENNSSCRIWNFTTGEHVATLEPTQGEQFGFCRFSQDRTRAFLFISMTKGDKGYLSVWDIFTWKRIGAKAFFNQPITALTVTHHGRRVAMGSKCGDICIVLMKKMEVDQRLKKVHNHSVTVLEFSLNDKALLSVASDCTSRVTSVDISKDWKGENDFGLPEGSSNVPSSKFFLTSLFSKSNSGHDEL